MLVNEAADCLNDRGGDAGGGEWVGADAQWLQIQLVAVPEESALTTLLPFGAVVGEYWPWSGWLPPIAQRISSIASPIFLVIPEGLILQPEKGIPCGQSTCKRYSLVPSSEKGNPPAKGTPRPLCPPCRRFPPGKRIPLFPHLKKVTTWERSPNTQPLRLPHPHLQKDFLPFCYHFIPLALFVVFFHFGMNHTPPEEGISCPQTRATFK